MVSWRGSGRGRCVTSEEVRLDRPASETSRLWQAPCLTWCVALLDRGGPLVAGRGRWQGGRDGRCGSIYVYPAVRRGVGLRGGNKPTHRASW